MNKITLNLGDIYALDGELNGTVIQSTGARLTKGILSQELPLLQKYWLGELADEIAKQKRNIDKLRDGLVIKFGVPDNKGGYTIPMSVEKLDEEGKPVLNETGEPIKELNPKFEEFNAELTVLFEETRELEVYPFKVENLDFKTEEYYPVFLRMLRPKKEDPVK